MGTAHPSFFGRMDTKEGVLMELKELCEKTFKIFDIKSTDELSQALFDVCKNNDSDKIDMFVNTVQDLSVDWLQKIFQYYQADRKEKMQDYTPKTLAELVGRLCGDSNTVIDMCAGSGALTIQKRNQNHDMKFILYEFDERVIPYLIFNMVIRNIESVIYHSDVLQDELYHEYEVSKGEKYGRLQVIK